MTVTKLGKRFRKAFITLSEKPDHFHHSLTHILEHSGHLLTFAAGQSELSTTGYPHAHYILCFKERNPGKGDNQYTIKQIVDIIGTKKCKIENVKDIHAAIRYVSKEHTAIHPRNFTCKGEGELVQYAGLAFANDLYSKSKGKGVPPVKGEAVSLPPRDPFLESLFAQANPSSRSVRHEQDFNFGDDVAPTYDVIYPCRDGSCSTTAYVTMPNSDVVCMNCANEYMILK